MKDLILYNSYSSHLIQQQNWKKNSQRGINYDSHSYITFDKRISAFLSSITSLFLYFNTIFLGQLINTFSLYLVMLLIYWDMTNKLYTLWLSFKEFYLTKQNIPYIR